MKYRKEFACTLLRSVIGFAKPAPLSQPRRERNQSCRLLAFPRAWFWLSVFFWYSDWCIALFTSVVIGQSDHLEIFTFSLVDWNSHYFLLISNIYSNSFFEGDKFDDIL